MNLIRAIICIHAILLSGLEAETVRFLAWDHKIAATRIQVLADGGTREVKDLHPDQRSAPVTMSPKDSAVTLVTPDLPGADKMPATVKVVIPAGMANPLVVLIPDPGRPSGIGSFVINDSADGFPFGSTRFISATKGRLVAIYDKRRVPLDQAWAPVDVDPGGKPRNIGIQIRSTGGREAVLYSAIWEYDPAVRKLAIVAASTDGGASPLQIKIIPENRRALAPPRGE